MKTGFYHQSLFDYIKGEGINRSFLHEMVDRSPGHAKYKEENQEITESLRLGDAFHAAILEPERFEKEYVVLPVNCKPRSGEGMKDRKAAFEAGAEEKGQTIIQPADRDNIKEMAAVIQGNQDVLDIMTDGVTELSGYFTDPEYDVLVKIRLDFINQKDNIIIDLKSCADAREFPFRSSGYNHGYDMQAFMGLYGVTQITGIPHNDFTFICVESKGYHGLDIYQADLEMLDTGYKKYKKAMTLYKQCLESDKWPGYDSTIKLLGSPAYAKEQREIEVIYDGDPIK